MIWSRSVDGLASTVGRSASAVSDSSFFMPFVISVDEAIEAVADVRDVVPRRLGVVHQNGQLHRLVGRRDAQDLAGALSSRTRKSDGPRSATGAPASSNALTYIERWMAWACGRGRGEKRGRHQQQRGDRDSSSHHMSIGPRFQ